MGFEVKYPYDAFDQEIIITKMMRLVLKHSDFQLVI